jgi:hypothetical protein
MLPPPASRANLARQESPEHWNKDLCSENYGFGVDPPSHHSTKLTESIEKCPSSDVRKRRLLMHDSVLTIPKFDS